MCCTCAASNWVQMESSMVFAQCAVTAHDANFDEFMGFQGQCDFFQHRFGQTRVAYDYRRTEGVRAAFEGETFGYGKG